MATYFGVLKKEVTYSNIKRELTDSGLSVLKYYRKLHVVKFEAGRIPENPEILAYFSSVEKEKTDFSS